MHPSPDAIAWIRAFIAGLKDGGSLSDQAVADAANAPTIPNPEPQPTRPKPWKWVDVAAMLSPGSLGSLMDLGTGSLMIEQLNSGDPAAQAAWLAALVRTGKLTPDEIGSVLAITAATEPDPSWRSHTSVAERDLGRLLDAQDVAEARQS